MKQLATLYSGQHSERMALKKPVCDKYLAKVIYLLDLSDTDLNQFDGLIIPEGQNCKRLDIATDQLLGFLDQGGTIFLFGDQPTEWLPGLNWKFRVASPPEPGHLQKHRDSHSFHQAISLDDFYHLHGYFVPPKGAKVLVTKKNGDAVFYIDQVSTKGTLVVSSLDLMHYVDGFFGNSVSASFFDRFLPWAAVDFL